MRDCCLSSVHHRNRHCAAVAFSLVSMWSPCVSEVPQKQASKPNVYVDFTIWWTCFGFLVYLPKSFREKERQQRIAPIPHDWDSTRTCGICSLYKRQLAAEDEAKKSKLLDRSQSVCILACNIPVVSVVSWWGNEQQYDNECCQASRTCERCKAWLYPHGLLFDKYQSYLLDGTCPFIGSSCKFRDIPEVARIRSRLVPWLAKSWKVRPMGWVPPPILGEHADSMPSTIELVLETRYPYPWEGDSSGNDG